jgi:hypothetical protein
MRLRARPASLRPAATRHHLIGISRKRARPGDQLPRAEAVFDSWGYPFNPKFRAPGPAIVTLTWDYTPDGVGRSGYRL